MIAEFIRDHALDSMRIAGRKARGDRTFEVHNPFNGELLGTVPKASLEDVRGAFEIAHACRPQLSRADRAAVLQKAASLVRERSDAIARLITAEAACA